ncbi:MAG: trypsin-like serine protease [Saprospiraceae bacterium]
MQQFNIGIITIFISLFLLTFTKSYAQEVFNGKTYYPMPMPMGNPSPKAFIDNDKPVFFNENKEGEKTGKLNNLSQDSFFMPGNVGALPKEWDMESDPTKSFTDMELVEDPDYYPMTSMVKIFMEYNGKNYVCSGTLIDSRHVLTAGHCIYNHDEGGWADEIAVAPAYNEGVNIHYGVAYSKNLMSWNGWTQNESYSHDMGIITLDRPIGGLAGWLGYGYQNDDAFYLNNNFHNPGYPAASPYDGQLLYYRYGDYDMVTTDNVLQFHGPSYGGQSGSGTYFKNEDGDRYVMSCHSHSNTQNSSNPTSGQTRLNENMFEDIQERISEKTPSLPDLIPLKVSAGQSYFSQGQPLNDLGFYLHNYSSSTFNGDFEVSFYLSTNATISDSDTYLGYGNFNDQTIGKKQTKYFYINNNPSNPIRIPDGIASGEYYIGILIENNDANPDNNNTKLWDSFPIKLMGDGDTTPTDEITQTLAVQCFPNPASDYVKWKVDGAFNDHFELKIFNALGQAIHVGEQFFPEFEISVNGWPTGAYSYQLTNGVRTSSGRFQVK